LKWLDCDGKILKIVRFCSRNYVAKSIVIRNGSSISTVFLSVLSFIKCPSKFLPTSHSFRSPFNHFPTAQKSLQSLHFSVETIKTIFSIHQIFFPKFHDLKLPKIAIHLFEFRLMKISSSMNSLKGKRARFGLICF
jgi:hypothetical protein